MLSIYIGFQATRFYCFPPPRPPLPLPPHFYCFPSTTTTTPPHFCCFPSTRFYKRLPTAILSSFCSNVSCSEQQSWFSSAVSCLSRLSAPVSFKGSYTTAFYALVQVLYNLLMGHIPITEENKGVLLPYKDALLNLASPNVPFKRKKRVLVQEGSCFIEDVLAPVV